MRCFGRTHRIHVAWLAKEFRGNNLEMVKTPSDEMAADIFTKTFPDSKADTSEHDLNLIKVIVPERFLQAPASENAAGGEPQPDKKSCTRELLEKKAARRHQKA